MMPRVLIVHTLDWPNAARLAMVFRAADCRVHALCRPNHLLCTVSSVEKIHPLNLFTPLRSIRRAIERSRPDLIIPCDDNAAVHLHQLHHAERRPGQTSPTPLMKLIERSLGDPRAYDLLSTRSRLGEIARDAGVLLPRTTVLATHDELRAWTQREGFPVVLKTDRSWGGEGVSIAKNAEQADAAFNAMSRRPPLINTVKRLLVNRDPNLLVRKYFDPAPTITAQQFIRGTIANIAVACWKGEVIASLGVEVVANYGARGTATVIRVVENEQMLECATRVARRYGISGFCGFDFMIEHETKQAYLIEINPRATQINHIILGHGRDLPGTLKAKIADEAPRKSRPVTLSKTIALFPQELERDRESAYLQSAYHDIPLEEPAFVRACTVAPTTRRRAL